MSDDEVTNIVRSDHLIYPLEKNFSRFERSSISQTMPELGRFVQKIRENGARTQNILPPQDWGSILQKSLQRGL